jgi:Phage integrase, N-terminal SAM-like domain
VRRRSPKHKGVYQRCTPDCPEDRCRDHKWQYDAELPAGPDGKRRQEAQGGFETARDAAAARAELVRASRAGSLAADRKRTLGEWLPEWVDGKVDRGELAASTARGYRDNIKNHIKPKIGHVRLAALRGPDLTRFYAEIARARRAEINEAIARNVACPSSQGADAHGGRESGSGAAAPVTVHGRPDPCLYLGGVEERRQGRADRPQRRR